METMQTFYDKLVAASEVDLYRCLMQARPEDVPTGDLLPWLEW